MSGSGDDGRPEIDTGRTYPINLLLVQQALEADKRAPRSLFVAFFDYK